MSQRKGKVQIKFNGVQGTPLDKSRIPLGVIGLFFQKFQSALEEIGYEIHKKERKKVKESCRLELVGQIKGGCLISNLELPSEKCDYICNGIDLGEKSLFYFADGYNKLRDGNDVAKFNYRALNCFRYGKQLFDFGLDTIDFHVATNQGDFFCKYDISISNKIDSLILNAQNSEPLELNGWLYMQDLKPGRKKCRITPVCGKDIFCTFDEEIEPEIDDARKQLVRVYGYGVVGENGITKFHIERIRVFKHEIESDIGDNRKSLGIELFKRGMLSLGQAAKVAGYKEKTKFIDDLAGLQICVANYGGEEIEKELGIHL